MFKYLLLIITIVFSGCSVKYTIGDFKGETSRDYSKISKDAIFEATKKIFIYEAQKDFRIDSYRNHLTVSRTNISFPPLDSNSYDDIFNLSIVEKDNISKAKLSIKRVIDFDEESPQVLPKSIHTLLWARIDYMLGLTNTWPMCNNFYVPFRYRSDALCDYKDFIGSITPSKEDQIKETSIEKRDSSKDLFTLEDDVLKDDITLTVDETKSDILNKEDNIDEESSDEIDSSLDKEIEKLDRKVSENIEETLKDIDETKEEEFKEE